MTTESPSAPTATIGIDISKDTLDACLLQTTSAKPKHHAFANTPDGHQQLIAWAKQHANNDAIHFCLESTGPYGLALAFTLHHAQLRVSVVNPAYVKYAGIMFNHGNKTDRADAQLIAQYARREQPPAWVPPSPEVLELQALSRRREELVLIAASEKTRLDAPHHPKSIRQSITRTLKQLEKEVKQLTKQIKELIRSHEELKEDHELLLSIPGIGEVLATVIQAELSDVKRFESASSAAAYAGLAPREYRSGKSIHKQTRMSKAGNARLRKALYLPTMSAIQCNPVIKAFYEKLVDAGKAKKSALGACMRKLLMIAYGVLKSRTHFDLSRALKISAHMA